jgi:hypothetical protein
MAARLKLLFRCPLSRGRKLAGCNNPRENRGSHPPGFGEEFKILKEAGLGTKGEPFKITGSPGYLLKIQREKEMDPHASPDGALSG